MYSGTRYNEVPSDWKNVFVIAGVRYKRNPVRDCAIIIGRGGGY